MSKRTVKAMPNFPGIYQNLVLDESTGKRTEPKRGAKYVVARSAKDVSGKRKREWESFESFADAKAFRNRTAPVAIAAPLEAVKRGSSMTVGELIEDWKANWLPNKELTTQIRYHSYLQHFDFLKDRPVEDIQPSDIDRWIVHIKKPEYLTGYHGTRCSYEHEYTVLRSLFSYYATRINRNFRLPFLKDHKAMLKVKEKMRPTKDLTVDQFRQIMAAIRDDVMGTKCEVVYYIAMMQYLTYGRVQDAAALHYESFDFTANKIRVDKKIQWLRASGHENRIADGSKKNGGKIIDMPASAALLFREWTLKTGIRSGLLFRYEGEIVPYRVIEYRYTKALRKLGLPFAATHILRHASLTEYYQVCRDLLATAKVAGHDDLRSTEKYAKVRDDTMVKNQRQMDDRLSALVLLPG
jgi:integrase